MKKRCFLGRRETFLSLAVVCFYGFAPLAGAASITNPDFSATTNALNGIRMGRATTSI